MGPGPQLPDVFLQQRREVELSQLLTVPPVHLPTDPGCSPEEDQASGSLPQRGPSFSELLKDREEEEEGGSAAAAGEAESSVSVVIAPQPWTT